MYQSRSVPTQSVLSADVAQTIEKSIVIRVYPRKWAMFEEEGKGSKDNHRNSERNVDYSYTVDRGGERKIKGSTNSQVIIKAR